LPKIYYKRLVEGITVPAVIHNRNYYYIDMPVYEDGSVDCWHRKSLAELKDELSRGWLVTEVPAGKSINIHGLGQYSIKSGKWEFAPDSYLNYLYESVKTMNNSMTGLFEETAEQKERRKTRKASWSTHETPYKLRGNFGYTLIDGKSSNVPFRKENGWELTSVSAYSDKTLMLGTSEKVFSFDEIKDMFTAGILSGEVDGEFELSIPGFAHLTVVSDYQVYTAEKEKEIEDMSAQMDGGKPLRQICRDAYIAYLIQPTELNRKMLGIAYENVPKHERMFLGDMDNKDADYQRILYHPERKREV